MVVRLVKVLWPVGIDLWVATREVALLPPLLLMEKLEIGLGEKIGLYGTAKYEELQVQKQLQMTEKSRGP